MVGWMGNMKTVAGVFPVVSSPGTPEKLQAEMW